MHRVKMGHTIRTRGPGITVVAFFTVIAAVTTNTTCAGTKTTVCEKSGFHCGPGQVCDVAQDACIDIGGCGDGIVSDEKEADGSPKEVCDDGNITDGDGCSANCKSNETCGNGFVDKIRGESCDDGERNGTLGDSCNSSCVLTACGNGMVDVNEDCDPGPQDSPGCNSNAANDPVNLINLDPTLRFGCKVSKCGDGYVNKAAGEECDDGILSATCNSPVLCTKATCGDGYYNPKANEECDTGGDTPACNGNSVGDLNHPNDSNSKCHIPSCGDNYTNKMFKNPDTQKFEECDTGAIDTSSCDFDCTTPVCGDGHVNKAAGEECDDGNLDNSDDCPDGSGGTCKHAVCGDGFTQTTGSNTEDCDTKGVDTAGCNGKACTLPRCGDGYLNSAAGELCDPGDATHPQVGCPGPGGSGSTCASSGSSKCKACGG